MGQNIIYSTNGNKYQHAKNLMKTDITSVHQKILSKALVLNPLGFPYHLSDIPDISIRTQNCSTTTVMKQRQNNFTVGVKTSRSCIKGSQH